MEPPVHHLFAIRAAETPDALAVADENRELNYAELDRAGASLARELVALGVGRESVVAVLTDRSVDSVIAILAILKAGGAFLPLDPVYPDDRLVFILRDAGVRLLLTQRRLLEGAGGRREILASGVPVRYLDDPPEGIVLPSSLATVEVFPDQLAYLIYTSGSTGQPKGVEVPHRGLSNTVAFTRRVYSIGPSDRASRLVGPAFDPSIWELWPYLTAGASVHFANEAIAGDPERLIEWVAAQRLTLSYFVTPICEAALRLPWPASLPLRILYTGGDRLHPLPDHGLPFAIANHYGPTEVSIITSSGFVERTPPGELPSIGRPIDGIAVTLVDASFVPVVAGETGELLASGAGVARGYHGRPDLTAERYLPDPFTGAPGSRLYRTGDLARFNPDGSGNLDFLGRTDHQVKVRGHRIELGEIEIALRRQPEVREALVLAVDDGRQGKRLVAYVTLDTPEMTRADDDGERSLTITGLRDALARVLPEPMVPTAWRVLAELPLNPNGKVDRAALPPVEAERRKYAAPRSGAEMEVSAIFVEVLERGPVGRDDDFFALGGHSLAATQVLSRVRTRLGANLPLRDFFENPTVRALAAAIERQVPVWDPDWTIHPLDRTPGTAFTAQASFAQQRIWIADRYSPQRALYNTPSALDLVGSIDAPRLEAALSAIVARHESLRTTLHLRGAELIQAIESHRALALPLIDLSGLPQAKAETEARSIESAAARRPIDLEAGPLLRCLLVKLAAARQTLLLLLHHAVFDDWSSALLQRELVRWYEASGAGPVEIPDLPLQVADAALWQRNWFAGDRRERELSWWRARFTPPPPPPDLPIDRPRPAVRQFRGAIFRATLAPGLVEALASLASRSGGEASPFMALLTVFGILVGRQSHADDLVVGTPVANRNRSEFEGLIGFFANTLALRLDLSGASPGPSFVDLVRRTRESVLDAFAHQDLPFELIVEELWKERDPSRSPLFDVMLIYGDALARCNELVPGVELSRRDLETATAKYDLTLTLAPSERPSGRSWEMVWESDSALFEPATVERWARRFEALVRGCIAGSLLPVSQLPLFDDAERRQLLVEWNRTERIWPAGVTLPDLFARSVAAGPGRVAVVCGDVSWTYAELDVRSDRLAHRLRALGVGLETRVALCVERSPQLVALLLAVHRAGAAYVPLDPNHPVERLRIILEDSDATVLVTESTLLGRLPSLGETRARLLVLDQEPLARPGAGPLSPLPQDSIHDLRLAYLIYTSGSTGRPKGVEVSQRALTNFLLAMADQLGLISSDVVPALTTIAFDIAALEIFLPLVVGARIEILKHDEAVDGVRLARRLREAGATLVQATPATWRLLLDAGWDEETVPEGGFRALCGGEALPLDLARELALRCRELWNVYGPTETTVWSTAARIAAPIYGSVSLGGPIANTRLFVVDRTGEPVALGNVGELWIGGRGVARGYHGRPDLTAERFVPDPWSEERGARLYRTGDLVRHRGKLAGAEESDAIEGLEFLGRIDRQVKVRGFRIELGEVESALAALPPELAPEASAVVAAGDENDRSLVGFLVMGDSGVVHRPGDLRAALRRKLPDYMIPSRWISLERLPTTPNGKLDRLELERLARASSTAPSGESSLPDRLRGVPQVLDLPFDFPRSARRQAPASVEVTSLTFEPDGVARLCEAAGVASEAVTVAVFLALLVRITGQDSLVFGLRTAMDAVAIGPGKRERFKARALHGDGTGDPTFLELLARTGREILAARGDSLEPSASGSGDRFGSPPFQALLEICGEGQVAAGRDLPAGVDLTSTLGRGDGKVGVVWTYASDLFRASSIRRLAGHHQNLFRSAIAAPEVPLSTLCLLSRAERHQLLGEWNPDPVEPAWPGTVEEQLRTWMERTPDRPAAFLDGNSWSFAELDCRAEQIARWLAGRGVGPGSVVAVLLDRSFDLLAALVGVLRAGASYLPIDPAMRKFNNRKQEAPAADNRFVFMMTTAGARYAVVEPSYRPSLPDGDWQWLSLGETPVEATVSRRRSWPARDPRSLAYVMFTSGSTGLPKGVAIPHTSQVRHARAVREDLALSPSDRSLQYSSMGFDVHGEEIWPVLTAGGAVVLISDPQNLPASELSQFVEASGLTVLNLPSPYWNEWVGHLDRRRSFPEGLRSVLVGSDAVSLKRVAQWRSLSGLCGLRHAYGLTETTVTSTLFNPMAGDGDSRSLPIGVPLPGVRAYVVDRAGQPVPIGVIGELWLGGGLLAQGVLDQPDTTAELFAPDPFAPTNEPGARVCRTGDLVRRHSDGNLEFVGRVESQVEIRGHRIEPAEIEALLESAPNIDSALVLAVGDGRSQSLRAFVVPEVWPEDLEAVRSALFETLRRRLPSAGVPDGLEFLAGLPTSENGKFDRRRLATLALEGASLERSQRAPETLVEKELAEIWASVLRLDWVNPEEGFWDLGGHSLLATRALARIEQTFGVELPLQTLFQFPILRDLARRIESELLQDASGEGSADDDAEVSLMHGGGG